MKPIALALTCLLPLLAAAQEKPRPPEPLYTYEADHDPNGIGKFYLGREIAHVMGHQAAMWLERPERAEEERPDLLMEILAPRPGESVADIGAGSGYHTFRMAEAVGKSGKVYAVDIQKEMLDIIRRRSKEADTPQVVPVMGTPSDPKLPAGKIDLIFMVDVYHEFDLPWEMTRNLVAALAPGGRLGFVEYRLEDPKVPIKTVHKMSEAQVKKEMALHPEMEFVGTDERLPWQHVVLFRKKPIDRKTDAEKADAETASPSVGRAARPSRGGGNPG